MSKNTCFTLYAGLKFNFRILLLLVQGISLTTALTNMIVCREMELCDLTNNVMFKSMYFLENKKKQPRAIHHKGDMYVHVTDKENTVEDETL